MDEMPTTSAQALQNARDAWNKVCVRADRIRAQALYEVTTQPERFYNVGANALAADRINSDGIIAGHIAVYDRQIATATALGLAELVAGNQAVIQ